uniref:Uncharacterized protein n=1 Tax=viral metagenome TaxID=1070528 RepID=A0A6M3KW08_9ZZZZ
MKILLIMIAILVVGCNTPSHVEIPIPGDGVQIIEGSAADAYVEGLVENAKTARARINEMLDPLKKIFPTLVFIFIGGLVFWGFTRSRFGWIIPASVTGGMVFIIAFVRWAEWIAGGVILLALAVLVWKAIEYHSERDKNNLNKIKVTA